MKLSDGTLEVLKNFGMINSNILIKGDGKLIRTKNGSSSVYAEYVPDETFSHDVALFDLNQFLQVHSLFEEPELDITDKYIDIITPDSSARYYQASVDVLIVAKKGIKSFEPVVSFDITKNDLQSLIRGASILSMSHIVFESQDGDIVAKVYDPKVTACNSVARVIGKTDKFDFKFVFSIEQMTLIPGDYRIDVAADQIAQFNHTTKNLKYWMAQDQALSSFSVKE